MGNNTYLKRDTRESIVLLLHNTFIIRWGITGSVVLRTGGWMTVTTKKRFNQFLSVPVTSDKGVWIVDGRYVFHEGMDLSNGMACLGYTRLNTELQLARGLCREAEYALYREQHKKEEFERRSAAAKKGAATRKDKLHAEFLLDKEYELKEEQLAARRAALGKEM